MDPTEENIVHTLTYNGPMSLHELTTKLVDNSNTIMAALASLADYKIVEYNYGTGKWETKVTYDLF